MTPRRAARGFTLVEVLVALIIVAFGMSAVLAALSSAADTTGRLRDKSLAEWIAFNQISTTRLVLQAPATGTTTGTLDYANGKWAWSQEISDLDIPGILRITVKVRRNDGSGSGTPSADQPVDWLATAIGFRGNAVNAASGASVNWNGAQIAGGTATEGTSGATGATSSNGDNTGTAGSDRPPGGRTGGPSPGAGPPGAPPANPGNGG